MSYILDALKKIEHEKNKRARSDGRISITGDLFQERHQPVARVVLWKIVLLIAVASLVTSVGTWFVLSVPGKKNATVIRPTAQPATVVSPPVVPVPVPVQSQATPVAAPVTAVPGVPKSAATVAHDTAARGPGRVRQRIEVKSPAPKQAVPTVPTPADIKLSGIAWQDERSARRVVVNGFLLKEGAVVSGAKITDIQADKVRFSTSAGQFEIKLDAVLPTAGLR